MKPLVEVGIYPFLSNKPAEHTLLKYPESNIYLTGDRS
jgi:hypothetical protein